MASGLRRPEAGKGHQPSPGSSVKPSHSPGDRFLCRTREVWQPRLGRDLSREETRQIVKDVAAVFSLLAEWSRAEMASTPSNKARVGYSEGDGARQR